MIEIEGIPTSHDLFQRLADEGKPVILHFSRGKDSTAVWVKLKEYGIETIPIYKAMLPNMKYVNEDIKRFEDHFQTRVINLPSYGFFRMLANNIYQTPERCAVLEACQIPVIAREDWDTMIRDAYATEDTWLLDGVRATDSATRRMAIKKYGPLKESAHTMSPIWDFGIQDVRDVINNDGAPWSVDYDHWPRSFDAMRWDFLQALREFSPEDYETIKFWFPLIELEMDRKGADGK